MRLRLIATGLILTLAASVAPIAYAEAPSTMGDAYNFLADAGAITSNDSSASEGLITRAEMLKVLVDSQEETRTKAAWYSTHLSKLSLFLDVSQSDWIAPYAETAFWGHITSGFPDRTLHAEDPVPAEEAITLLMRAYHVQGEAVDGSDEWFAPFVRAALARNVVASPRSMAVGEPVTRGQFFDMVYRMAVVSRDNLVTFQEPASSQQIVSTAPAYEPMAESNSDDGGAVQEIPQQPTHSEPVIVAQSSSNPNDIEQYASSRDFSITIPSLGIKDLAIAHPEDTLSSKGLLVPLESGVGHLFSYPGKGGKIMIYGHSSGYSWDVSKYTKIFRQVNKLKAGDKVYVTYNGQLFEYSVTGQQTISPKDASPFTGAGEELILYTCWPPNSIKQRLIVKATPVETVALR